jgi:glucokinase
MGVRAIGSDLYQLRLEKARECGIAAAVDARSGDLVGEVLDEAALYLGIAAANLVSTLNPRLLILGGAVIRALPDLVDRVRSVVLRRAQPTSAAAIDVVRSQLGTNAVPVGAAAYLLSQVSRPSGDAGPVWWAPLAHA